MASRKGGRPPDLTVVGTGMKFRAHMTLEALESIEAADKVLFVAADIMTEKWLQELNPSAERLPHYLPKRPRGETYALWVDHVMGRFVPARSPVRPPMVILE